MSGDSLLGHLKRKGTGALLLVTLSVMTACGGGGEPEKPEATEGGTGGSTETAAAPAKAGLPPKKVADMLYMVMASDRTTYVKQVVNRFTKEQKVHIVNEKGEKEKLSGSEDWEKEYGKLPLPAQMFRMGAELCREKTDDFDYQLISSWPINKKNKPQPGLESDLIKKMETSGKPQYGEDTIEGSKYFVGMYPDRGVAAACVDCHNEHPDSPKDDFKLKEVMGGVVIRIPLADGDSIEPKKASDMLQMVMASDRTVYVKKVVNRFTKEQKVKIYNEKGEIEKLSGSEDWEKEYGKLPLPAQMFRMGAELCREKTDEFDYQLISSWPINKKNKPQPGLESDLIKKMETTGKPQYGEDTIEGSKYFVGMYPDRGVAAACVDCHNEHPDSPKTDFKLKEVMGGVVIRIPLDA